MNFCSHCNLRTFEKIPETAASYLCEFFVLGVVAQIFTDFAVYDEVSTNSKVLIKLLADGKDCCCCIYLIL